jgi:copper chaperone
MATLRFKTDLKCNGCIQKITPFLSKIKTIEEWHVDLNLPDRTLTVEGNDMAAADIISALDQAGYKAEQI